MSKRSKIANGFNAAEYKKYTGRISDSSLQLTYEIALVGAKSKKIYKYLRRL